jgi:hypothetical protein
MHGQVRCLRAHVAGDWTRPAYGAKGRELYVYASLSLSLSFSLCLCLHQWLDQEDAHVAGDLRGRLLDCRVALAQAALQDGHNQRQRCRVDHVHKGCVQRRRTDPVRERATP